MKNDNALALLAETAPTVAAHLELAISATDMRAFFDDIDQLLQHETTDFYDNAKKERLLAPLVQARFAEIDSLVQQVADLSELSEASLEQLEEVLDKSDHGIKIQAATLASDNSPPVALAPASEGKDETDSNFAAQLRSEIAVPLMIMISSSHDDDGVINVDSVEMSSWGSVNYLHRVNAYQCANKFSCAALTHNRMKPRWGTAGHDVEDVVQAALSTLARDIILDHEGACQSLWPRAKRLGFIQGVLQTDRFVFVTSSSSQCRYLADGLYGRLHYPIRGPPMKELAGPAEGVTPSAGIFLSVMVDRLLIGPRRRLGSVDQGRLKLPPFPLAGTF